MKLRKEDFTSKFAADTMAKLKARSQQTNQARIGKYGPGSSDELRKISKEVTAAESGYTDELEQLAVQVAKEMYPVVDKYNIKIDAKIEPFGSNTDIPKGEFDDQPEDKEPTYTPKEKENAVAKRELVNALSQGAGVKASTAYKGMETYIDYLNDINPELVKKYDHILGLAVGGYDDDRIIASVLARIGNDTNMPGGSSYPVWDKEKKQWTIVARGINFPILMHEIGKGIYSIIGQQGFSKNTALNKATISAADKLKHEPTGLRYGKFIIDDIGDVLADLTTKYKLNNDRIRELFFAEMYKLPYDELYSFVENCINKSLTPSQEAWARQTMQKLNTLREKHNELDENNFKKAIATGALALGLAGSPNTAKAQDKVPTPTTQQQDTAKTATATYTHPNENTARSQATVKARAALAIKLGKPEGSISASVVDTKMYQLKDGKYECTVTVESNELKEVVGTQHYLMLGPKQLELFKNYGAKLNSNVGELYIPDALKIELDKNLTNSNFKKELYSLVAPEYKSLSQQVVTGLRKAMKNQIKIGDKQFFVLKGTRSKNNSFYFNNPYSTQKK